VLLDDTDVIVAINSYLASVAQTMVAMGYADDLARGA
jgi:hypothetical protein